MKVRKYRCRCGWPGRFSFSELCQKSSVGVFVGRSERMNDVLIIPRRGENAFIVWQRCSGAARGGRPFTSNWRDALFLSSVFLQYWVGRIDKSQDFHCSKVYNAVFFFEERSVIRAYFGVNLWNFSQIRVSGTVVIPTFANHFFSVDRSWFSKFMAVWWYIHSHRFANTIGGIATRNKLLSPPASRRFKIIFFSRKLLDVQQVNLNKKLIKMITLFFKVVSLREIKFNERNYGMSRCNLSFMQIIDTLRKKEFRLI